MKYFITKSEMEAAKLMSSKKSLTTNDSIKDDADYIVELADKIKNERLKMLAYRE
jgi:hypothetical protein